jgi:hypothetical protein
MRVASDAELKKIAKRIGVQVDVLLEARVNAKLQLARAGRDYGVTTSVLLQLDFAREPWEMWQKHCESWGVTGSLLLRSLVHLYLQGNYEPPLNFSTGWLWQDRQLPVVRGGRCREKTHVTRAALDVLRHRASLRGDSIAGLLRALVVENMKGSFGRPGLIQLVEVRHMFGDRSRYVLGNLGQSSGRLD